MDVVAIDRADQGDARRHLVGTPPDMSVGVRLRTRPTITGRFSISLNVGMMTTIRPKSEKDAVDTPTA